MKKMTRVLLPAAILSVLLLAVLSFGLVQAQVFGTNWIGEYYANPDLSGSPAFSRLDPQVNFAFGEASPLPGIIPVDNFSVRWTTQEFLTAGRYRFFVTADDGARVTVNGTTIMDFFANVGSQLTQSADLDLPAGEATIVVEYVERAGAATVQFFWEPAITGPTPTTGPTATITPTGLPPIPPGALSATVIRASVLNIRDAPSLGGNRIDRILRGQTYQVVGRNEDASWFLLQLADKTGWAYGYYLFFNLNEFTAPVRSATTLFALPQGFNDTGVLAQARAGMRMRAAPDLFSEQTGRITWGAFLPVVGRTAAGDWYQVLWKGTIGWVFSGYLQIIQGELGAVPVR